MKKTAITLFLLLPFFSFSQGWDENGDNTTNGRVIIENPNNNLASFNLSWLNDIARIRIGGTGVGASNGFDFQTVGDASRLRILGTGNVGIGTSNPLELLQVGSTITFHSGGHAVIGFNKSSSGVIDPTKYSSEMRYDPVNGFFQINVSNSINTTPTPNLYLNSQGYLGVGSNTQNPSTRLVVQDGLKMKINFGALNTGANSLASNEPVVLLNRWTGNGTSYVTNGLEILKGNTAVANNYGLAFTRTPIHEENDYSGTQVSMFIENSTGNVGIGTIYPTESLTINGKILCEEVKVVSDVTPDFVFETYYNGFSSLKPDYKIPSLEELESFIKANHHLPEVPSAQEMEENGMQLKEMTNLLLQKVEELTLYTIEQQKQLDAQAQLIKELQKEIGNKQ